MEIEQEKESERWKRRGVANMELKIMAQNSIEYDRYYPNSSYRHLSNGTSIKSSFRNN